jgi:medium-chain acyl-[acyl-carrier-protein] hydrolase
MDSAAPTWEEQRRIESFDVDICGRLRPQALFAYLLNSAWNHARGTVYGYDCLSARNLMWVLIKMQMAIHRLPGWGDRVKIETWGKRIERLYALRDFAVSSASGEKMVSATSSWMVLDKINGRPQRFHLKADGFPWHPGREEMKTDLQKVPELQSGEQAARFRVLFSDIDVNRHVNSSKYLQWMIDSHSRERLEQTEPKAVELSFLAGALPDDEVAVFSEERGESELCSVIRVGDNKELCRARFAWRPSPLGGPQLRRPLPP